VVDQVATGVFRAATEGGGKVTIALTPQNLGRVEVEIEVKDGSKVTAVVVAERQETLDLLRRDAHTLERALADAGLKTDSNSLQFHLRGQARDDGDSPRQRNGRGGGLAGDTTPDDPTPTRQQRYGGALGGVDVTI
jgi:flagellar hook-length control protein FliK